MESVKRAYQAMTTLSKQSRIGVLYGGLSSEREVSLRSGKNCFEALQRLGYTNCVLIDAGRDIAQKLVDEKIEIAYNALHGKYGEDGCIQGLTSILGIPCTGNGVAASAITMDKAHTKAILKDAGLPVLPSINVNMAHKNGKLCSVSTLNYPVMVKPMGEGSSVGMSKVDTPDKLQSALALAAKHDQHVMVEEFIKGKSITVGVFDRDGVPTVTPILELRPVSSEWYDYEAKYTAGATEFILPAELPEDVTKKIQETTLAAHKAVGCHGLSRIDFMVDAADNGRFYILEINTVSGMTDISDLPAQAKAMGVGYDELVEYILKTAIL